MNKTIFLILALLLIIVPACATAPTDKGDIGQRNIQAVATIGMIADIVREVGGDRVEVTALMGPGVDPHLYKASEGDVILLQQADIIFYNGLHLEAQMGEVLERMNENGMVTVAISEQIDPSLLSPSPTYEGYYDPHIWFDVTLWMKAVEQVRDSLIILDPTHAETYQANADSYLVELAELHEYVNIQAERIPAEQRVLITAHDAFHYFGKAYGFEVRGLQGISTETQAGTADVQALTDFIVERQIPAIFVESSVAERNIEAVQAAVQARGFDVTIGGSLFSDAMGSEGTPEGTYIGMVRHNIDTIVRALLGD